MPSVASRFARDGSNFERPSSHQEPEKLAPVVLMVSGGADSTALLFLALDSPLDIQDGRGEAKIARERLHVLHVNHMLRGIDAEEDEEFVRQICARYGLPCTVERADVSAIARQRYDGNVENAGREVRYALANRLANELSAQLGTPRSAARILTAHTADDRAETFLMNAIRGSGVSGLSSIPRRRNRIVRPLLDRTHDELCELLRMKGIVWREDDSNSDTRYLRAFVRHEVLPLVRERNPHVVDSLSSACDIISDEDVFMNQLATRTLRTLERRRSDAMLAIDLGRFRALDVAIARRVVRTAVLSVCPDCRLEAQHINSVLALAAAQSGSTTLPMGVDVRVEYGLVFIRARSDYAGIVHGWLELGASMELGDGRILSARLVDVPAGTDVESYAREVAQKSQENTVCLDARAAGIARGALRVWVDSPQAGDIICPIGMSGRSKKLSDLLNEQKIPAPERDGVCVVRTAPTGPILWVAQIRVDERARCTKSTEQILELSIRNA